MKEGTPMKSLGRKGLRDVTSGWIGRPRIDDRGWRIIGLIGVGE